MTQNCVTEFMVLSDLLRSKMTKNQAHISLWKSEYSLSTYASYNRNRASKNSLGIYENPILVIYHWCNGTLCDSSCHSGFSVDKGNNFCLPMLTHVQQSDVCIALVCSLLRPHLCSLTCMKQFVNSSGETSLH